MFGNAHQFMRTQQGYAAAIILPFCQHRAIGAVLGGVCQYNAEKYRANGFHRRIPDYFISKNGDW